MSFLYLCKIFRGMILEGAFMLSLLTIIYSGHHIIYKGAWIG